MPPGPTMPYCKPSGLVGPWRLLPGKRSGGPKMLNPDELMPEFAPLGALLLMPLRYAHSPPTTPPGSVPGFVPLETITLEPVLSTAEVRVKVGSPARLKKTPVKTFDGTLTPVEDVLVSVTIKLLPSWQN